MTLALIAAHALFLLLLSPLHSNTSLSSYLSHQHPCIDRQVVVEPREADSLGRSVIMDVLFALPRTIRFYSGRTGCSVRELRRISPLVVLSNFLSRRKTDHPALVVPSAAPYIARARACEHTHVPLREREREREASSLLARARFTHEFRKDLTWEATAASKAVVVVVGWCRKHEKVPFRKHKNSLSRSLSPCNMHSKTVESVVTVVLPHCRRHSCKNLR